MGDNKVLPYASSEMTIKMPTTDIDPCDSLLSDPIEEPPSFVGALETAISATPRCRASPPVVGRTTSTTLTTSVLDFISPVTSKTGIEPVDSGFSSWTVAVESNPHFSPTLMRLDSEGHQTQHESQVHDYGGNRSANGATGLNSLSCASAVNDELCDRMFMTHLVPPPSSCSLDQPISEISCSNSWLVDDTNDDLRSHEQAIRTTTTDGLWKRSELTEGSSLLYSERAQSPFRPVNFLEINSSDSTNNCVIQHDTLAYQLFNLPVRSSVGLANFVQNPQSSVITSAESGPAKISTTECDCHRFHNNHRPGSAPLKIAHGSVIHSQSVDATDDEPTSNPDDASLDTANDGDDERDTCTPTLRVRRHKQQQKRSRSLRYSHPGLICCSPPIHHRPVTGSHYVTQSGNGDSNGIPRTQSRVTDGCTINSNATTTTTSAAPNSIFYLHHKTSRTRLRTDPLWLRRRHLPPVQTLDVGLSASQRHSIHGSINFTLPDCDSYTVPGTTTLPRTVPPMPDVVPRENCIHLRSLQDGSTSPSFNTLFPPFPIPTQLYRSPLQRIDSVRNSQTPRCASVPLGSLDSPRSYATTHNYHQNVLPDAVTNRSVHCTITRYHHHTSCGVSQSTSGPLLSDSLLGGHDQLSLFARRMAHIGDELVAQRRLQTRTRYSLPTDSFFNSVRSAAHTAHSLWNLSSSLASLMTVPLDYVNRIVQIASHSLSGTSTQATNSPIPVDTHESRFSSGYGRRRAETYAGVSTQPCIGHTRPQAVPAYGCAPNASPVYWSAVLTSTPAIDRSRRQLSTDSSALQQASPIDEARNVEYIFHFENE